MASGTTIANMNIALHFDTSGITSASSRLSAIGKSSGSALGNAWTVAMGTLMAKGISKVAGLISNNLSNAIKRVDTLDNFPKVMSNLGISAEASSAAIKKMSNKLQGLPTNLDEGAAAVQRFTSKNGDVRKSTDIFLALNNAILAGNAPMQIQSTALEQISQAYAKGKPDMIEWRSLMSAMPAQLKQVAIAMGYVDVEALGEALRTGKVSMDDFMSKVIEMNTKGVKGFKSFEDQAKNSTAGIGTALNVMNSRIGQGIVDVIKSIGSENISKAIIGIGNALKGVGLAVAGVVKFIITNWGTIQPILMAIGAFLGTLYAITTAIRIATAVQAAFNIVLAANPIGLIVIAIAALVAGIVWFITQTKIGQQIFQTFCQVAGAVFGALKDFIVNNIGAIKFVFGLLWSWLKASVTAVGSFIILPFRNAFNNIRNTFNGLRAFFSGLFNFIRSLFKNFGATIGKVVGGAFKGVVNGVLGFIEGFINKPVQAINGLIDIINKVPKVNVPRLTEVHLPRMAQGGVVDSATAALIGEAGQEAVLPLERNTGNWAGLLAKTLVEEMEPTTEGRTINVYMENKIDSKLDAQAIGQEMMQAIRRAA